MKVLQVNAVYKTRSTGRIVMEIHQYLKDKGIDSYAAYATMNTDDSNDSHIIQIGNKIDHKIHALAYRIDHKQGCHSLSATKAFIKNIKRIGPDIVLTHNLHSNYIHVPYFLKELKKMGIHVVIDLHDCWFMTGGCYHYTANGCMKWLDGCKGCELFGRTAKEKYQINCDVFDFVRPTIVATSKWIEREARKSLLSERADIRMIYDWIDTKTFYPRDDKAIREKLGINDRTMILGVSTGWSADKGQEEMIQIANEMLEARVVLVGNQPSDTKYPENVITIAFTDSKEELAQIYSAADVFFNPSKQETFGLVSGEALACGTPLVVYNTTACPEFVTEYTGVIMEDRSQIVSAVNAMLQKNKRYGRDFVRKKCREFVEENFNMEKNIDKYIELFDEICNAE